MPEVTVRDAHRGDAAAIGEIGSSALPWRVRSTARAAADLREDRTLLRRRWVGLLDGDVVATATATQVSAREVVVSVEVRPDCGSCGLGTLLLRTAAHEFSGVERLTATGSGDPISMAFAVRNGFLPDQLQQISRVDPREVAGVEDPPTSLRAVTLEALPDLRMLLETTNASADGDPFRRTRRLTMYQLRAEWWDSPDNAPSLSFGLIDDHVSRPLLAGFSSVAVDRDRGRAWSSLTVTHPAYRRRGVARWVKQRSLQALAGAGVGEAWTASDDEHAAMLSLNSSLGYRAAATTVRLIRRLPA